MPSSNRRRELAPLYRTYQRDVFLDALRAHLPAEHAGAMGDRRAKNACGFACMSRCAPYWIALPIPEDAQGDGIVTAILLSLGLACSRR